MTKSEAKAIERRAGKAFRILAGTYEPPHSLQWMLLNEEQRTMVDNAIREARDEVYAVLEMANAELGEKR